jgi:general stress protein CsbA
MSYLVLQSSNNGVCAMTALIIILFLVPVLFLVVSRNHIVEAIMTIVLLAECAAAGLFFNICMMLPAAMSSGTRESDVFSLLNFYSVGAALVGGLAIGAILAIKYLVIWVMILLKRFVPPRDIV